MPSSNFCARAVRAALVSLLALPLAGCAIERGSWQRLAPLAIRPLTAGPQEQRVVDRVLIVTDASGSVYSAGEMTRAKWVTENLVAALPEGDIRADQLPKPYAAAVFNFGGSARRVAGFDLFDREMLRAEAARLKPIGMPTGRGGETPQRHVFVELRQALANESGRTAAFFISDGLPDFPDEAKASAQRLFAGIEGEFCLHAIQLGDVQHGANYLQALADMSGCGSLRHSDTLATAEQYTDFLRATLLGPASDEFDSGEEQPYQEGDPIPGVETIYFDFNQSDIREDQRETLNNNAAVIRELNHGVTVSGHCDERGSEEYNLALGERRANAVKDYLVELGIPAEQLETVSYGESQPAVAGSTEAAWGKNRRAEFRAARTLQGAGEGEPADAAGAAPVGDESADDAEDAV